jgi:diacylglycerol kinase (ATP)
VSRPRIALVVNPAAGVHSAADVAPAVVRCLSEGAAVTVLSTAGPAETRAAVRSARADHDAVLSLGGDGTAHAVLQEMAGGNVPMGVIPAGTGNDMADVLGIPADPVPAAAALLEALRARSVRRVDLGRTDGATESRWWFTVLCTGFDSAVNETANRLRWPRGARRYDVAIAVEALRLKARPYRLVLDGRAELLTATMVSVGNAPQYGGGKLIVPDARLDDGRLTVCIVGPITRRTLARMAPKLDVGGHVGHPAVRIETATEVVVEAESVGWADGERVGPLPLTCRSEPGALPALVPPGTRVKGMASG